MRQSQISADPKFVQHFRSRIQQIFLYVTDECNIRCRQCYYKPSLRKRDAEMPISVALGLMSHMHALGAAKISFLGGEPTLYGSSSPGEHIGTLVKAAKDIGFEYVRIVTNGLFEEKLLNDRGFRDLDEITFSIDGDTAEIHDALRGKNSFIKTVSNLVETVGRGYRTHVTMCAHKGNIGRTEEGGLLLSRAIQWAGALGVASFNIHPLLRMGVSRDNWTGNTHITPEEWLSVYEEIQMGLSKGDFSIPIRIPMRFIRRADLNQRPRFFGYCSVRSADRLDIHRDGHMHTCSLHNSTSTAVARFTCEGTQTNIKWIEEANEYHCCARVDGSSAPCPLIKLTTPNILPLCVSLKPGQKEFAWDRAHKNDEEFEFS